MAKSQNTPSTPSAQLSNYQLIRSFLAYLRSERGTGDNTVASYENDVWKFTEWFDKPLAQAQRTDLQKYLAQSLASGMSGRSGSRRLAGLRHFYRFLIDEGEAGNDPTRNLPVPKSWKRVPKALRACNKTYFHDGVGNGAEVGAQGASE